MLQYSSKAINLAPPPLPRKKGLNGESHFLSPGEVVDNLCSFPGIKAHFVWRNYSFQCPEIILDLG